MRQAGKQDTHSSKSRVGAEESKAQQTLHGKVEHPVKDTKEVKWRSCSVQEEKELWEAASR